MSGHNKWSKIKHKKAATDGEKSKIFSKMARLITVEAKKVGGDLNSASLKNIIEKAKSFNMPNDNIERAVKKASDKNATDMEYVRYEAYGPGGSALIIEGLTDNRNRTAAEVKSALSKNGLDLAQPGSASWAFEKTDDGWSPTTTIPVSLEDSKKIDNIIEVLEENDDVQVVYTNKKVDE